MQQLPYQINRYIAKDGYVHIEPTVDKTIPCDGRAVSIIKNWELFRTIGYRFGRPHHRPWLFRVPDLRNNNKFLGKS